VKKRGVGEYAIEMLVGKNEFEEILLPHFAASICAGHNDQTLGTLQTDREMTEFCKYLEASSGSATKIEYCEWRLTFNMS